MKTVNVQTARPYDVHIGYGLLPSLGETLRTCHPPCRVALVSDENVDPLYGDVARRSLMKAGFAVYTSVLAPGEGSKTLDAYGGLLFFLAESGLTRSDVVVALGGGVVGDLAGFAAATYLRGIAYVQAPTTLLAAVDASVGGKTAVNLPSGKNTVGAFWQPLLVVCDCDTFETLPYEVYLDGVAESLKYGVITDRKLFEEIASGGLDGDCLDIVARCVAIKAEIVAEDERDTQRRALLNFGHTIAHALEILSGYTISHGHAVSIGMVGMARVSETQALCAPGCAGILMAMLDRLGLPCETSYTADAIAEVALRDKKRAGDTITLIVPESIGHCMMHSIPAEELPRVLRRAKGERV